jgi:hypothetical protein
VAEVKEEEPIIEEELEHADDTENLDDEDDFEEDGEVINDHLEGLQDLINSLGGPENF